MAVPFLRMGRVKKKPSSIQDVSPKAHKLRGYIFGRHVLQGHASREAEEVVDRLTKRFLRIKHKHKEK